MKRVAAGGGGLFVGDVGGDVADECDDDDVMDCDNMGGGVGAYDDNMGGGGAGIYDDAGGGGGVTCTNVCVVVVVVVVVVVCWDARKRAGGGGRRLITTMHYTHCTLDSELITTCESMHDMIFIISPNSIISTTSENHMRLHSDEHNH